MERRVRPDAGKAEHFILPSKAELQALLAAAKAYDNTRRAEAVIRLLMFAGLRMSEFRGLLIENCSLSETTPNIRIVQRADRFDKIGSVKSVASRRTIEIGDETAKSLQSRLDARLSSSELVFANDGGNIWSYSNFWHRFWVPLLNTADLVTKEPASKIVRQWSRAQADYKQPRFGPHTLRHVYASLQIEHGVTPKRLQRLMGIRS